MTRSLAILGNSRALAFLNTRLTLASEINPPMLIADVISDMLTDAQYDALAKTHSRYESHSRRSDGIFLTLDIPRSEYYRTFHLINDSLGFQIVNETYQMEGDEQKQQALVKKLNFVRRPSFTASEPDSARRAIASKILRGSLGLAIDKTTDILFAYTSYANGWEVYNLETLEEKHIKPEDFADSYQVLPRHRALCSLVAKAMTGGQTASCNVATCVPQLRPFVKVSRIYYALSKIEEALNNGYRKR